MGNGISIKTGAYGHEHLRFQPLLHHISTDRRLEAADFHLDALLHERSFLRVLGDQRCALTGVLGRDVAADGAGLVENKTIVILECLLSAVG